MLTHPVVRNLLGILLLAVLIGGCQAAPVSGRAVAPAVLGTWTGESICVGNRPACKNEVVVYRFEAVPGKPQVIAWLADKIIEGKRVPMGKLEFQYDEVKGRLSCDFRWGQTHGLWEFSIAGDTMTGTLVLFPNKDLGRRVTVRRVSEKDVPAAPARTEYEEH